MIRSTNSDKVKTILSVSAGMSTSITVSADLALSVVLLDILPAQTRVFMPVFERMLAA